MTTPPLGRWSDEGALRELARLAREPPSVDADEAHRRVARRAAEQRAMLTEALERLGRDEPDAG